MNMKAREKDRILVAAAIVILFIAAALSKPPCYADTPIDKETTIDLDKWKLRVDSLTFLSDESKILMISNEGQKVVLFDLKESKIIKEFSNRSLVREVLFTAMAIGPEYKYAYLIGVDRSTQEKETALVRLDLDTFDKQERRIPGKMLSPSIAVARPDEPKDSPNKIFIGDLNASTIIKVSGDLFENDPSDLKPSDLIEDKIYLKNGPAIELGVSQNGKFVFVSHAQMGKISLVDTKTAEVTDEIEPADSTIPLGMFVTTSQARSLAKPRTSLIIGDFPNKAIGFSDLDPKFRTFSNIAIAPLGMGEEKMVFAAETFKPPLIVSASSSHRTIVVGNRHGNHAFLFSRIGNSLERRNGITLKNPILDIDVSPSGGIIAVLNSDKKSLKIILNPSEFTTEPGIAFGSERIRDVQRELSLLGYPVGPIDGFYGPNTRRSVALFQKEQGIKPTGTIDKKTIDALYNVVKKPVYVEAGKSKSLEAIKKKIALLKNVHLVENEINAYFAIDEQNGNIIIQNPDFGRLSPTLSTSDPNHVQKAVDSMNNLISWKTAVDFHNPKASIKFNFDIYLNSDKQITTDPIPIKSGKEFYFRIENPEDRIENQEDTKPLYVYILVISSDGTMDLLFPILSDEINSSLLPEKSIKRKLRAFLPEGNDRTIDVLKAIVTTQYIDPSVFPRGYISSARMPVVRTLQNELALFFADSIRGKVRKDEPHLADAWATKQKTLITERPSTQLKEPRNKTK